MQDLSKDTRRAAGAVFSGKTTGLRRLLPFVGPAFIASVAYIDPGNFATNIQGGSQFGYQLLWVVLFANMAAMLFQNLSAKLGIATGKNLAELSGEQFPRPVVLLMWGVSEVAAMATDLAEFLGATIALNLLLHLPMAAGAAITAIVTYAMLQLQGLGFRPLELLIGGFLGAVGLAYLVEVVLARPNLAEAAAGFVPSLAGSSSVTLAVGIVGATVMPHAIYIHSSLTQSRVRPRNADQAEEITRFETIDVMLALGLAGLINLAMLANAAAVFHSSGHSDVGQIDTAYQTLTPLLGAAAAAIFAVALLVSGLSSSVVGTMAGQVVMQGFLGFQIPVWLRRLVTMLPALAAIGLGLDPTQALVMSQVVLSLSLPAPLIALVVLTRRRTLMGPLANAKLTSVVAIAATAGIGILNVVFVVSSLGLF